MSAWKRPRIRRTALGALLVLAIGQGIRAEEAFEVEIKAIVDDIAPKVKTYIETVNKDATVTVGAFDGLSDKLPFPGTAIQAALTRELEKQGIPLSKRGGTIRINGTFKPVIDPETRVPSTLVTYTVMKTNESGNPEIIVSNKRLVVDRKKAIELTGTPVKLPTKATDEVRDQKLIEAIANPPTVEIVEKSRVRIGKDSPYEMQIWVNGRPREIKMVDGLPFVEINNGESFAVNLFNNSQREAGVSLLIDGINSFSFQEPNGLSAPISDWTVPALRQGYIQGWYINPQKLNRFELTDNPKDIAAETINADSSDIGAITAVFKVSWTTGEPKPSDEPSARVVGVKRGADVKIDAPPRDTYFGVIRESITIRYQKAKAQEPPANPVQARAAKAPANQR